MYQTTVRGLAMKPSSSSSASSSPPPKKKTKAPTSEPRGLLVVKKSA